MPNTWRPSRVPTAAVVATLITLALTGCGSDNSGGANVVVEVPGQAGGTGTGAAKKTAPGAGTHHPGKKTTKPGAKASGEAGGKSHGGTTGGTTGGTAGAAAAKPGGAQSGQPGAVQVGDSTTITADPSGAGTAPAGATTVTGGDPAGGQAPGTKVDVRPTASADKGGAVAPGPDIKPPEGNTGKDNAPNVSNAAPKNAIPKDAKPWRPGQSPQGPVAPSQIDQHRFNPGTINQPPGR